MMQPVAAGGAPSADSAETSQSSLVPPQGIDKIIDIFGDIRKYIRPDGTLDPQWQADMLSYAALPVPLMLSFDHTLKITHFRCHKLVVDVFERAFRQISEKGLEAHLCSFGGCFAFRPQRTGTRLSTHSWGIAIDLNPETNAQGTLGDMNRDIVSVFQQTGFEWGGDWAGQHRDPMHFQFCSGY